MLDVVARACQDLTANAFVTDFLSLRRPLRIRSFPSTQLYHGQEQKDETLHYFYLFFQATTPNASVHTFAKFRVAAS